MGRSWGRRNTRGDTEPALMALAGGSCSSPPLPPAFLVCVLTTDHFLHLPLPHLYPLRLAPCQVLPEPSSPLLPLGLGPLPSNAWWLVFVSYPLSDASLAEGMNCLGPHNTCRTVRAPPGVGAVMMTRTCLTPRQAHSPPRRKGAGQDPSPPRPCT